MTFGERIRDPNVIRVYWATLLLGLAYGMAISLIALYLDQEGFDKSAIGSLAAWFALGIVAASLPMGALIERFSARNTLIASLAGYALTVSIFPFLGSYGAIALVRLFDGAFSVGVWMSSETILLSRAGARNKAFVTSLYAITVAAGYILGPLAARALVSVAPFFTGFVAAGALSLVACGYVALRLERGLRASEPGDQTPEPAGSPSPVTAPVEPRGTRGAILWRIKNSCYATFAYGYFQASVVLFLPLYMVHEKGIARDQPILIPAFFAGGMLLFVVVFGRLGDRFGHLGVMRLLAVVGLSMILGFVFLDSFAAMAAAVFVAGATLASISPLSLALQGAAVHPSDYPRANAIYNAFYAAGMLLGPPLSSQLFSRYGGAAMLYHLAALWVGFVAFTLVFHRDDPAAGRGSLTTEHGA